MAYDDKLASRIRTVLASRKGFSEKKMFGGIAFMMNGKMCCGVQDGDLVARIGADEYARALAEPHVRPMDFTGRPMKGYVYVGRGVTRNDRGLQAWVERAIAFTTSLPERKARKDR